MSKTDVVIIQQLEVNKKAIDKVKKAFKLKDNGEAVKKALDVASGKIELEGIFEKYRGTRKKKVYA